MLSLADFNPTPGVTPTLGDFNPAAGQPTPSVVNDDTASNMAAHGAILSHPDQIISDYNNINSELKTGTSSNTLNNLLKQRANIDHQATYDELQKILADPSISTDDKAGYMNGYIGLVSDRPGHNSLSVTVAKQAAITPSSNETDEAIHTIVPADGSVYDSVDKYNGWVQKQINATSNSKDDNWFTKTAGVIESMIPFVDQLRSARTSAGIGKINNAGDLTRAMLLLGDSRDQIRQSIATMPVDKRYELAHKVLDMVQSAKGPIFNQMDTLDKVNQLNAYLNGTGYSTNDKVTDNIFSILDTTIVLSPLLKLGKGVLDGVKAASALKRAAKVSEDAVAVAEPEVTKIVKNLQLTYEKPSGPTIFVNKKGEGSSDIGAVESPPQDMVDSTADLISKRILEKFNKTDPNATFYPGESPKVNMVNIHDDLVTKVKSILTPSTFNDPDIIKKVNAGAVELLKSRSVLVPKTFKASSSQLVRQAMDESNVARLSSRTTVAPTSVSQTVKDYNPEKARAINQMVVDDQSGQAAKALYGTTRPEAIANDFLPEVDNVDGSVRNKVNMEEGASPDATVIKRYSEDRGRIDLDTGEKTSMRTAVRKDFQDVVGMVPRTAMGTVGDSSVLVKEGSVDKPTGIQFNMIYGPKDGEFKNKGQALSQALFSLRKYGVTENEIEILGKTPEGNFLPAGKDEFPSYLVRVKHAYEFTPADTVEHTLLSNGNLWNLFDSRESFTDGHMGSLGQHFVPASAVVNKVIFNSASVAADKSAWYGKQLFDLAGSYGKKFTALDERQKALVDAYRIEANDKGLKFNYNNLKARGLSPEAISTLEDWKKTTDTLWWLENVDANKTARARGFVRFTDTTNDTDLMVKMLPNRGYGNGAFAYDSTKGKIVELKKADIDTLYERGGGIAQTRSTVDAGNEPFDYIIVQNKSESSYVRRIRNEDDTLPYRDGYYPIKYNDTYFIERQFKKADGTMYKKAIGTAGTLKDAQRFHDRILATDNAAVLNIRNDYKLGSESFDEANWSYLSSSGRSSQRVRGKRLEDASGVTDPDHVHIESPEESLIHAIRSTASRTAFRDWVDTTKSRWMAQYGDLIDAQKGVKMWPEDVRAIGKDKLQFSNSQVKDAKVTWRHVHAMEAGYVNLLDDTSKNFFKEFSNIAGRKGWGWLEKPLRKAAEVSPSSFARRKAFRLLLAANPIRQVTVQASQALPVLLATNPLGIPKIAAQNILLNYMKIGGDVDSWYKVMAKMATGLTPKEATQMVEDYEKSGFEAAVDANSLIRNQLNNIVDRSVLGKAKSLVAKPLNIGQKLGFNAGENFLMRTVWLSEYDLLKKAGTKIDAEVLENLNARVRNLTLNMNKGGELPYNENVFSAALQFFQAPHKAFAQIVLGHKGLSGADRLRLGAAYVTTFGIGGGPLTSIASNFLPKDDNGTFDTKDLVEGGLFNLAVNAAFSTIFGKTVRTDFSDSFRLIADPLQPVNAFWHGLIQGTMSDLLTSGASVGLVLGDSPRVTNFVKQMLRAFTVDDSQKPEEFAQTGKAFLQMFSGGSNYFKGTYALEWQKSLNARGGVVDYHVNDIEAMLKIAGFSTVDEIHQYANNEALYQANGTYKDDIALCIDTASKLLANENMSNEEADWTLKMLAEGQRCFKNNPLYMKEFSNQIMFKARTGENSIFTRLLATTGYTTPEQFTNMVNGSHLSDENKKILLDSKTQFDQAIQENKDNE